MIEFNLTLILKYRICLLDDGSNQHTFSRKSKEGAVRLNCNYNRKVETSMQQQYVIKSLLHTPKNYFADI